MIEVVSTKIQFNATNITNVTMVLPQKDCVQTVWCSMKLFDWRINAINHSTSIAKIVPNCVSKIMENFETEYLSILVFLSIVQSHQEATTKNAHAKMVSSLILILKYATFSTTVSMVMLLKSLAQLVYISTSTLAHAYGQTQLIAKDAKLQKVNSALFFSLWSISNMLNSNFN